jgi:hypothetical protein
MNVSLSERMSSSDYPATPRLAVLGVKAWMLEHDRSKLDVKYLSTEVGWRKFFPQPYVDQHKPRELSKTVSQGIKGLAVR